MFKTTLVLLVAIGCLAPGFEAQRPFRGGPPRGGRPLRGGRGPPRGRIPPFGGRPPAPLPNLLPNLEDIGAFLVDLACRIVDAGQAELINQINTQGAGLTTAQRNSLIDLVTAIGDSAKAIKMRAADGNISENAARAIVANLKALEQILDSSLATNACIAESSRSLGEDRRFGRRPSPLALLSQLARLPLPSEDTLDAIVIGASIVVDYVNTARDLPALNSAIIQATPLVTTAGQAANFYQLVDLTAAQYQLVGQLAPLSSDADIAGIQAQIGANVGTIIGLVQTITAANPTFASCNRFGPPGP